MGDNQEKDEDASAEEGSLDDAKEALADAQGEVQEAQEALEEAQLKLAEAQEALNQLQKKKEQLQAHMEERAEACRQSLTQLNEAVDEAQRRLAHAEQALNAYLEGNPSAAQVQAYQQWRPAAKGASSAVTIRELRDRLSPPGDMQRELQRQLMLSDKPFGSLVTRAAERLNAAETPMQKAAAMRASRINVSGAYSELLAKEAFTPLFDHIETQRRTVMENGRYTKSDIVATGARAPIILGRGERLYVPKGGSLGVEVKSGKSNYLRQQTGHMQTQAFGHQDCSASLTLCSRDLHDLERSQEGDLRDALRASGSPLVAALPLKDDIDRLCWELVQEKAKALRTKP